jgi:hypothetical protein
VCTGHWDLADVPPGLHAQPTIRGGLEDTQVVQHGHGSSIDTCAWTVCKYAENCLDYSSGDRIRLMRNKSTSEKGDKGRQSNYLWEFRIDIRVYMMIDKILYLTHA